MPTLKVSNQPMNRSSTQLNAFGQNSGDNKNDIDFKVEGDRLIKDI